MSKDNVDQGGLRVSAAPPPESSLKQVDDVFIVVTQAFCQYGHNVVDDENEMFDGYPGIRLVVENGDRRGEVTLSPFHGDSSKKGTLDWEDGTKLKILCPTCEEPLPRMAGCRCQGEGDMIKLFLTPALDDSHVLGLCNIWGCRRSRTIDNWQIISEYLNGKIAD